MKKFKIFTLSIIILLALLSLCACLPTATEYATVFLSTNMPYESVELGEFRLASYNNDDRSSRLEILPKDKDDFIKFLKQSPYYIDTFKLNKESYYLNKYNKCDKFKGDDTCMWFTANDIVWMGKFYANKFYYFAYCSRINLQCDAFWIELTEAIFTTSKTPPSQVDEEYPCTMTWEQLKLIYSARKIDEQSRSIELDCHIYYKENPDVNKGKTLMYYNTENQTIRVSKDYYIDK